MGEPDSGGHGSGDPDGGSSEAPLQVVIVDDHEVLRAGTRQVLETAPDIVVVGEADDGETALAMVRDLEPDVVLVDIRLPGHSGIEVARRVSAGFPGTKVVILSAYDDPEYLREALAAGVAGYLLKTMPRDELINAVRAAGLGTTVLDAAVSSHLTRPARASSGGDVASLTTRERQVVELVADGLANKTIAARLGISARTIEGHLNHIFAKLGVASRTELVRFALANNLSDLSRPSGEA
ncbi:MAG TPA: response regulator transcription factor [Acidimicrobiales bacterium]|nr:response regulator transcription factor [Acidimicrobiales bacterium]